ncbi:MAG: aldo/keto reductase [Thermodesulfobacteriota bacterium]
MEYRELGLTGLRVSRLGFGCWAIGGHGYGQVNDEESIRSIRKALDLGINFFDTADVYGFGHSEEILSKALGSERKKVVVATKFGISWDLGGKTFKDCSPKRIEEALEGSLKRLRLDSVPLYQIHWYDGVTPIPEIMMTLRKCQEAGKIQHIGCSNFSSDLILEFLSVKPMESLQTLFNMIENDSEPEILRLSNELRIGVIVYGVLARGLLTGKYGRDSKFGEGDTRSRDQNFQGKRLKAFLRVAEELKRIGLLYYKTPSQVAIRWVLENEHITCALTGIKDSKQVEDNVQALGWRLSPKDRALISAIAKEAV